PLAFAPRQYRRDVVPADAEVLGGLVLGRPAFLTHCLQADRADFERHGKYRKARMLTVIFGAGASYDSNPDSPPTSGQIRPDRPPLSDELFADRFGYAVDRYRACRPLIHDLRRLPAGTSIEEELDRLT